MRNYRATISATALAIFVCGPIGVSAQSQEDADNFFNQQQWQASANSYSLLLEADNTIADNWFKLGRSLHELGQLSKAKNAYETAIKNEYARKAQVRYHLARLFMSMGEVDAAITQVEQLAVLGAPSGQVISATKEFEALKNNKRFTAVIEALTPCSSPEYRHFDFWIGEWNVTAAGNATSTAQNSITSAQDGCVILEQYSAGGFSGMSLNFYDAKTGKWHQSWMSNAGGAVYLEGGLTSEGAMRMSDENLPISKISGKVNRVTWTPLKNGSVRQHWEQADIDSNNWSTIFDGNYKRKSEE